MCSTIAVSIQGFKFCEREQAAEDLIQGNIGRYHRVPENQGSPGIRKDKAAIERQGLFEAAFQHTLELAGL